MSSWLYNAIVISAGFTPSTFATVSELILNTLPEAAALLTTAVALVVESATYDVFPIIEVVPYIFGAAITYSYPKISAITIAVPAEAPPEGAALVHVVPFDVSTFPDVPGATV